MKAIVNVNPESNYSKYNGLTFEVAGLMSKIVALNIAGTTVDFSHKEILIVDLLREVMVLKSFADFDKENQRAYANFKNYMATNNIAINENDLDKLLSVKK